ncbi:retrotransposon protein, putative, ty1-copia subclass [Tanacetum coccineum]
MHNMGKTIGELHALLIEYEKGKGKGKSKGKDKSYIPKPKNPKPSAKEHPTKDDACHHYKEVGQWKKNCHVYLAELIKKKKQVDTSSSSGIFTIELFSFPIKSWINVIYEIDMINSVPDVNSIYTVSNKRANHNLDSTYLWHCRLAHISKKRIEKLQHDGLLKSTDEESFDKCVFCLSGKMTKKPFTHRTERVTDLLGIIHTDVCGLLRHVSRQGYLKETMGYYFYFPPKNKTVVARYAEFLEKNHLSQEISGRAEKLEEIQDEDTSPSKNTSEIPMEVEGFEPPQEEVVPVQSDKWLDAINAEMQPMKDNQVWCLVDLPPNCKTVGSKWLFKKKFDMYGIVHTYKSCLVAKGFTQTYGVDYEEMFLPVADIRAIRILIAIAAIYDYGIWQMDVKTAFLNGYLDEDIYMVQPEGFIDPRHPRKCFAIKDLGEGTFILGIKIYRDRLKRLIGLSQSAYMDKILKIFRMDTSKRSYIPMQEKLDLNKTQGASSPEEVKHMFLVYGGNPEAKLRVDCYCDAGFETDRDDIKSQTRYVFVLNGGAVDWKSYKQSTTTMSPIEAKYIADSEAAMEAIWIRKFISGFGTIPTINEPIKMFCDNLAALHFAYEPGVQMGARHYRRRYHYVRECIELGEIKLLKVHIDDNLADPFTKALSKGKLTQHARSMGLRLASSFM